MTRDVLTVLALGAALALGASGVAATRTSLNDTFRTVKAREDVYALPPPAELKLLTLGYRSAVVDLLWAGLLVDYGRHWADKRPMPHLEKTLDAILELEPDFPTVYRFVDTLLVFRPLQGTEDDARKARAYLERGIAARPLDHRVWTQYGQFIAFLAGSFIKSDSERERWRMEGSEALVRAVELGAPISRTLSATSVLSRAGRRAAALTYLERAAALSDDPVTVAEVSARLARLESELQQGDTRESPARRAERLRREARGRFIDDRWRDEMPFVPRTTFLLLGPYSETFRCAGVERLRDPVCAHNWGDALAAAETSR